MLLEPETSGSSKTILTYHVVPGKIDAATLEK